MIRFISGLDFFLPSFLLRSLQTSISEFTIPTSIVCPSVINQVTFQEVTVDPYLKVQTKNYYYLLSLEMTSEGMQIDNQDSSRTETRSPDLVQDRSPPRKITVEDSMDVLSELINEIQASNDLKLDIQPQPKPNQEQPSSPSSHSSIRFSLARQ